MKKIPALAIALVALALCSSSGLTQQRTGSQDGINTSGPTGSASRAAPIVFRSTDAQVNWPASLGRNQADLVKTLRGQRLRAEVVGSGAQEVIVIYGPNGECRVCIGGSKACNEACPRESKDSPSSVH